LWLPEFVPKPGDIHSQATLVVDSNHRFIALARDWRQRAGFEPIWIIRDSRFERHDFVGSTPVQIARSVGITIWCRLAFNQWLRSLRNRVCTSSWFESTPASVLKLLSVEILLNRVFVIRIWHWHYHWLADSTNCNIENPTEDRDVDSNHRFNHYEHDDNGSSNNATDGSMTFKDAVNNGLTVCTKFVVFWCRSGIPM
jgi:hypothetical protein